MDRASGSYPAGRRFESRCRYHKRPVGQSVKTSPFHGGVTSSTLVRVTMNFPGYGYRGFLLPGYLQKMEWLEINVLLALADLRNSLEVAIEL